MYENQVEYQSTAKAYKQTNTNEYITVNQILWEPSSDEFLLCLFVSCQGFVHYNWIDLMIQVTASNWQHAITSRCRC